VREHDWIEGWRTDRILTTHAGRLDGPPDYREMVKTLQSAGPFDAASFVPRVRAGIVDVIRKQAEAGIDIRADHEESGYLSVCLLSWTGCAQLGITRQVA
jgi:hypothetical protein